MTFVIIEILSEIMQLAAIGLALFFWMRLRQRWFGFLAGTLALIAARQLLALQSHTDSGIPYNSISGHLEQIAGLVFSVLAVASVLFLRRVVLEQRAADASLREGERRFRDLIDSSVDRYWESDESHRFNHLVEHTERSRQPPTSRTLGRTRWDVIGIDPEATEKWRRHQADLEAHRPFRDFRYAATGAPGEVTHWRVSGKPIFDSDGRFRGYRGVASEETEHVQLRNLAEEALRESESRAARARAQLFDAIESLTEAFALYDADDRQVVCNQKYREVYPLTAHLLVPGIAFEEQIRASAWAGEVVEAVGREEEWVSDRLAAHQNPSGAHEQALGDGRWLRISERRTKDGGIVGVRTDITALKKVEQELRRSEARFRDFAESASDWVWETDCDHRFTHVSRGGLLDFGLRPADLLGKRRHELSGMLAEPDVLMRHIGDQEAHRPFRDFVYHRKLENGRIVSFKVSGKPLFADNGTFLGYRGVGSDITAEIEAEEKRREAETRLARAIETIPAAFTLFDPDDRLVAFNRVNQAIYERPAVPMVAGAYYPDLVRAFAEGGGVSGSKADADAWVAKRLNRRNDPARAFEFRRSDDIWIEINDYILEDNCLITVGLDITEQKRREEEVRQRQAELAQLLRRSTLDELASVMAHELNQPLSAMVNFANGSLRRIRADTLDPEDLSDIMTRIRDQARRASDVLRRIGGFVGHTRPERGPVDMAEIVQAVATLLQGPLQAGRVRLQVDLADSTPPVLVDRIEIEQVLLNLAKNAIEAMEATPVGEREIQIRTRAADDGSLEVTVTDTGPGFDADFAPKIFQPFMTTKENGMGMGLSISRTIVEAHGGRIRIDRRERGAAVCLILPFDREALEDVA